MADLRDALRRSGVVDPKTARRLAHEEAARKKKLGAAGVDAERALTDEERRLRDEKRRDADRDRERKRAVEDERRAAVHRLARLIEDRALTEGVAGSIRFHFVTREKKIPFLDVSEKTAEALTAGDLAICEIPGSVPERFALVPADVARKVQESDQTHVLFLNERRGT